MLRAYDQIVEIGKPLGLSFAPNKMEVIPTAGKDATADLMGFKQRGISINLTRRFVLLKTTIGDDDFAGEYTDARVAKLQPLLQRLGTLPN